ncbi:hypothetical protein D3C78_1932940 [compost metagenome]
MLKFMNINYEELRIIRLYCNKRNIKCTPDEKNKKNLYFNNYIDILNKLFMHDVGDVNYSFFKSFS